MEEGIEYAEAQKKTFRQAAVEVAKKIGKTAKEHPVVAFGTVAVLGASTVNPFIFMPFAAGGITHFASHYARWSAPSINGTIAFCVIGIGHLLLLPTILPTKNSTLTEADTKIDQELLARRQTDKAYEPFVVNGKGYSIYVSDISQECRMTSGKEACEIKAQMTGTYMADTVDVLSVNLWRTNGPKVPYSPTRKELDTRGTLVVLLSGQLPR